MEYDFSEADLHQRRALTEEENSLLQRRLNELPGFLEDAKWCIEEMAEASKVLNPQEAVKDLDGLLPVLDAFWKHEDFEDTTEYERVWFITRLMYFIGE